MTIAKLAITILLISICLRIFVWPPDPIHIEEVSSSSGVAYVCIYESEEDFKVAKLDKNTPEL